MGLQIATGSYVGNGTDARRIVTGLSGNVRAVWVVSGTHIIGSQTENGIWWSNMMAGECLCIDVGLQTSSGLRPNGADFEVDTASPQKDLNGGGVDYYWIALAW